MRTSAPSRRSSADPALATLAESGGLLALRVTPRAASEGLSVDRGPDGAPLLRVRVTAPPEGGKANAAVLRLVARALGLPKSALSIERGASGRDKLVRVAR